MTRIVFTGSRRMRDWEWMRDVLLPIYQEFPGAVLVHGAQSTWDLARRERYGADYLADRIWIAAGGQTERHPAEWDRYGRAAGMIRNGVMAERGADLGVATPIDGLPCAGTWNMVRRLEARDIPVRRHIYRQSPVP